MRCLLFVYLLILSCIGSVEGLLSEFPGRKASLTALSGGLNVGLGGRGGGVDPKDLEEFVQLHSQKESPPKTPNQLYNPMDLHRNGWRLTRVGTLFRSKYLIRLMGWLLLSSSISGVVGWHFADIHDMSYFEHLEDALHALITFLLGLFLSTVYNRWAALFSGPYGTLWGAINGISFYGNQYISGPNKSKILLQNLRWGNYLPTCCCNPDPNSNANPNANPNFNSNAYSRPAVSRPSVQRWQQRRGHDGSYRSKIMHDRRGGTHLQARSALSWRLPRQDPMGLDQREFHTC